MIDCVDAVGRISEAPSAIGRDFLIDDYGGWRFTYPPYKFKQGA